MADGPLVPFDAGKPSVARIHDYALGGKDNFAVDRELTAGLREIFPLGAVLARESREFQSRAVGYAARQGVVQFIDVGSGMPASPSVHEVAGLVSPDARVAYVDNDPVVISHAAALLARPGQVAAVPGDVRCPRDILASPGLTGVIDTSRPFCVILAMILNFIEPAQAAGVMAAFRDAMPAGSFLVLSFGINDNAPDLAKDFIKAYSAAPVHQHSREQVTGYFAGLEVVEPGLIEARNWRPAQPQADAAPRSADALACVGRKAWLPWRCRPGRRHRIPRIRVGASSRCCRSTARSRSSGSRPRWSARPPSRTWKWRTRGRSPRPTLTC
jgi:hypothetical protein